MPKETTIAELLALYQAKINIQIAAFLQTRYQNTAEDDPERIFEEAIQYAVLSTGKRLRPILAMLAYEYVSKKSSDDILSWIIGLEFLHAYTLVHDDLPNMDNDEFRRWELTVWKKYNESTAILVGDALQTLAFEVLSDSQNIGIIKIASKALWDLWVIRWQIKDLAVDHYQDIHARLNLHRQKTGMFLECALQIGATAAQANEKTVWLLTDYGFELWLAFQIADDLLDAKTQSGNATEKGKGLVTLLGIKESEQQLLNHTNNAIEIAKDLKSPVLQKLAKYLAERNK